MFKSFIISGFYCILRLHWPHQAKSTSKFQTGLRHGPGDRADVGEGAAAPLEHADRLPARLGRLDRPERGPPRGGALARTLL